MTSESIKETSNSKKKTVTKTDNSQVLDIFDMYSEYRFVFTLPSYSRESTVIASNENITPAKVLNLITKLEKDEGVCYHIDYSEKTFNIAVNNIGSLLYAMHAAIDATDIYDYFINCISSEEEIKGKTYIDAINRTISKIKTDEDTRQVFSTALTLFIRNSI